MNNQSNKGQQTLMMMGVNPNKKHNKFSNIDFKGILVLGIIVVTIILYIAIIIGGFTEDKRGGIIYDKNNITLYRISDQSSCITCENKSGRTASIQIADTVYNVENNTESKLNIL